MHIFFFFSFAAPSPAFASSSLVRYAAFCAISGGAAQKKRDADAQEYRDTLRSMPRVLCVRRRRGVFVDDVTPRRSMALCSFFRKVHYSITIMFRTLFPREVLPATVRQRHRYVIPAAASFRCSAPSW